MFKITLIFISIIVMFSSCSLFNSESALDNIFLVEGIIYDNDNNALDSVNIKILSIDASEGHNTLSKKGFELTSDVNGNYAIRVSCGTTYTVSFPTKEKTYTKYIRSITLEFSKEGYNKLIKEFVSEDLEETNFYEDIILSPLQ